MTALASENATAVRDVQVQLIDGGPSSITMDGTVQPLRASGIEDARKEALKRLTDIAAHLGSSVNVTSAEPDGTYGFIVTPEGSTHLPSEKKPPSTPTPVPRPAPATASTPASAPVKPSAPVPEMPHPRPTSIPVPAPPAHDTASSRQVKPTPEHGQQDGAGQDRQLTRMELKAQRRRESLLEKISGNAPATQGLRGVANIMGLSLPPSPAELTERADIAKVSQHWPGLRTIAIVNGKGGSGKTPTTILLSAVLARYGGGGVIAWDNNSTRGTLGWRTEQADHDRTVADLIPAAEQFLQRDSRLADLDAYTHHQRVDRFNVLRSKPELLSTQQPSDEASFRAVHAVLARACRIIMIDTGNDESTPAWSAMIAKADALVVPTRTLPEHAESARLLLDELACSSDQHAAHLAGEAIIVVSQSGKAEPTPERYVGIFNDMAGAAVGIPYDPGMSGSPLLLDSLAPPTRRAWIRAAAALADALG